MKCPICNETLVVTKRQGVEIDYCPHYCGVWLDRGELDKIIKRSALGLRREEDEDNGIEKDKRLAGEQGEERDRQRRRKTFLGEIFDLD